MSFFAIGATGLCGAEFVKLLSETETVKSILTLSRRPIATESPKITPIIQEDVKNWPEEIKKANIPEHSTFFSGFGTTRAQVGGIEKFKEIDYGVNYECAKAARETGKFDTIILISSSGANANSMLWYLASKGKLEDDIVALKFPRTIILRPGPLTGRQTQKRAGEVVISALGSVVKNTFAECFLGYPISNKQVAEATYKLASEPLTQPVKAGEEEVLYITAKAMLDLTRNK